MKPIEVKTAGETYPVMIERGNLDQVGKLVGQIWQPRKVKIVTDDNVGPIYLDQIKKELSANGFKVFTTTIKHGEKSKSLSNLERIITEMANEHFNRSDGVVALGGGVVGDLAGFVSATYMRGIALIQIPTSFLAQVDSSVGGKTAVDLNHIKNIVGSFHQPEMVIIDPDTLNTLTIRNLVEGYAETVKCAALAGGEFWELVSKIDSYGDIIENADRLIHYSIHFKANIVMQDEKESGVRQLLNLGHTIGHGVEGLGEGDIMHGEAVAIGLVKISQLFSSPESKVTDKITDRLSKVGLPITSDFLTSPDLIEKIKNDKKNHNGYLNIIYLSEIGKPVIKKVSIDELDHLLNEER
ncbi:3-dehydroquinate synthase [Lactobacillus sp. Sy-1]|uniref:3-dehydroquinate synthase n=1 Tax=Lactobacillus sp. Sy-1 TaxID=2109645 RepID=UPI001C5A91CC|nr:3-dehydroquinate synthase [Lactobacillus sp. Sy-1]MBW1606275.1 3-dehydroquinate synthase [Lactobacillus sp. Sy-1]